MLGWCTHLYLCCQVFFLQNRATSTGQFYVRVLKLCTDFEFRSRGIGRKTYPNPSFCFSFYYFVCHKEASTSLQHLRLERIAAFLRSPHFYYIFTSIKAELPKSWETPSFYRSVKHVTECGLNADKVSGCCCNMITNLAIGLQRGCFRECG